MAARLYAQINQPFRVAVQTTPSQSVDVQIILPDLTNGALLSLTEDPVASGSYSATFTPTLSGTHQLDIQAPATAADGQLAVLVVSTFNGYAAGDVSYGDGSDETGGLNLRWPCPTLRSMECIDSWTIDQINEWADVATVTLFGDTCRRFPGTHNFAKLRPQASSGCLVPCAGGYGLDLFPTVHYPVLEICSIEIDGTEISEAALGEWQVIGQRYLSPTGDTSWPSQDLSHLDGAAGTWAVTVRYGRNPPALAVRARDRFLYSMLINEEPTISGASFCKLPDGTTGLAENGRTITIDHNEAASTLYAEAIKRWKCRGRNLTGIHDPAEDTSRGSSRIQVVPGDPTPTAEATFSGSGCDLAAQLAALTP